MGSVTFRDETAMGKPLDAFQVPGLPQSLTARELIRLRVREEVARHNAAPSRHFNGLVRPDDAEIELNGYRLDHARRIDWERQADIAERAFQSNGFFMLVGERQVEHLDEVIDLTEDAELIFIKKPPRRPPPSGGGGIGPLRSRTGTGDSPQGEPPSGTFARDLTDLVVECETWRGS